MRQKRRIFINFGNKKGKRYKSGYMCSEGRNIKKNIICQQVKIKYI